MKGYMNKVADVDLTSGTIGEYPVSDKDRELFLGGKALAAKIIYDNITEKIDPLSPQNIVVIMTSPLNLSNAASSSRFDTSSISPLTGLLASSNCGGNFGLNLKRAGYDGIVIRGAAASPTLIRITEEAITLEDASNLWGKTTGQTQEAIGGRLSGKFVIGPAGENLVRYACIVSEERAAGRSGLGAVLGSKNLKGLVAEGKKQLEYADKDKFNVLNKKWIMHLRSHPLTGVQLPKYGTAALVAPMNYKHLLATKNYSSGSWEHFESISGETLKEKHLVKNKGCITCPIQCGRVVNVEGKAVKGPEVETLTLFGSNLLNSDMQSILDANHYCDEYGLDTITFGSSVGFAMELQEKGLWDSGLNWGDGQKLTDLVKKVAYREGIGDVLAEGTRIMAQRFGGKEYAINVKGLELAAYEPRAAQGMGLGYATANRGGCHLNGGYMVVMEGLGLNINQYTTKGKAAFAIFFQNLMEAVSAGGSCLFTTYAILPGALMANANSGLVRGINKIIPSFGGIVGAVDKNPAILGLNIPSLIPHCVLINYVTGMKLNIKKFVLIGERCYNLERMMNVRLGVSTKDDTLPERLLEELQQEDNPDSHVKLEEMKKQYYKIRGWDANGIPTEKRLKRLGLL